MSVLERMFPFVARQRRMNAACIALLSNLAMEMDRCYMPFVKLIFQPMIDAGIDHVSLTRVFQDDRTKFLFMIGILGSELQAPPNLLGAERGEDFVATTIAIFKKSGIPGMKPKQIERDVRWVIKLCKENPVFTTTAVMQYVLIRGRFDEDQAMRRKISNNPILQTMLAAASMEPAVSGLKGSVKKILQRYPVA